MQTTLTLICQFSPFEVFRPGSRHELAVFTPEICAIHLLTTETREQANSSVSSSTSSTQRVSKLKQRPATMALAFRSYGPLWNEFPVFRTIKPRTGSFYLNLHSHTSYHPRSFLQLRGIHFLLTVRNFRYPWILQ